MQHEESESDGDARGLDAATATDLLQSGASIGAKVYESVDFRTQAVVQAGTAAATFVYAGTFLYLFGGAGAGITTGGTNDTSILLIPILALSQLSLGVRERLKAVLPTHHPKLATALGLLSLLPLLIITIGMIVGQRYPWWILLAVAIIPAIQPATLAIFSARKMRRSKIGPLASVPRVPLSSAAQLVTAGLGILCGLAAALSAFEWRHFALLGLMIVLLTMLALYRTRWGLPSVGGEWGSAQWLGFGASFLLLMAMAVILVSVPLPALWIGVVGGIVVALPLVLSAFRGSPIRDRPEELWDASPPPS